MIIAISILFFLSCLVALFEEELANIKWNIYIGIRVLLVLFAAIRPIGMDNDSENYELYFVRYDHPLLIITVEYSFRVISKWFYLWFHDVHSIFLLYAALGLSLKFIAFKRLTALPLLAVAVYIGNYYILHEFTQIRVGVASGLLLLAIKPLSEKNYKKTFVLFLLAIVFHYSSIILLPLMLLSNKELTRKNKIIWASLIPLGYIFYFLNINITSLPIPYISEKLDAYQGLKDQGYIDEVNVFNLVFFVRIIIFFYILYMYDLIREHNLYLSLMIKLMALSLFSFTAFSSLPVLAFRISELYGITEIILFTNIFYTIRPKPLAKIIVITISITLFCISVFYNNIIQIM